MQADLLTVIFALWATRTKVLSELRLARQAFTNWAVARTIGRLQNEVQRQEAERRQQAADDLSSHPSMPPTPHPTY